MIDSAQSLPLKCENPEVCTSQSKCVTENFSLLLTYIDDFIRPDLVQKILYDADEWSCPDSKPNEQENVVLLVVLCGCSIRSPDKDLWEPVMILV